MILHIKNMVSLRCKLVVKELLIKMGMPYSNIEIGMVEFIKDLTPAQKEHFKITLKKHGLELLDNKKSILIEKIKNVILEMIHFSSALPKSNYSEYISQKLNYDYTYLSNIFSDAKGINIQQYIIIHKIERVKELLMYNELNLKEISNTLHYSSVSHLSNQFKKTTGFSPSNFKQLKAKRKTTHFNET